MPDQSKLAEILCRMQSDFVLEHIAAADDFIKEGFPTNALFSIIQGFQVSVKASTVLRSAEKREKIQ